MSKQRAASSVNDYAMVKSNKNLAKFLDQEDVLFSDAVTKTNQYGRRQHRVIIVTQTSLYNFKQNNFARPQRQFPLERLEAVFLSEESPMSMLIRVIDEKHVLKMETTKRAALVRSLQAAYTQKTQRKLKVVQMTHALFEKGRLEGVLTRDLELQSEMLRSGSFDSGSEGSGSPSSTPPPPLPKREPKNPPRQPKRRSIIDTVLRRSSQTKPAYRPVCPPCHIKVGVVQPIWSLVERALEPLEEETKPPPGLVRCADILFKAVGAGGPSSTEEAIKAVAALCFDKDAARALLKSLSDNVPILGGSALVDSLDALQRCEDAVVRKWAIKALWKLLPMCMAENALPTTSNKWMAALNGASPGQQINQGEEAFLATYFGRGMITHNSASHEQEPLRRIMRRKGSFTLLGGAFKSSSDFPSGLNPVLVQQGFSLVLLQNLFDLQRRAGDALLAASSAPAESIVVNGLVESDLVTVLEILLASLVKPQDADRRIDVIGKRIRNPALLPTLMGMLVLVQDDSVRQTVLKEVSLLLLRSETNLKAVLDIPNWQLLFIPLLQTVPRAEALRNAEHRILHKYVLNLLTMIHTYCFKEPSCQGGPLLQMLGNTFLSLAVYADWQADTIGVARWVLFGLVGQLELTARAWWHDDTAPEWPAFAQLVKAIEIFVFFLPEQPRSVAENSPPRPVAGKSLVAGRAIRKSGEQRKNSSLSEDDSDLSDDEGPRSLKHRKRKFSITPVYELKGFDPVVRPLGPSDALASKDKYAWILSRFASSGDVPMDSKVGLHLNPETGRSLDLKLVGSVVELLKRMGITGVAAEDERRRDALKSASKKAKGLLKTASEWLASAGKIAQLLDDLDVAADATNADAVQSTMARVQHYFAVRFGGPGGHATKLKAKQAKAMATKLEASVLRQRQLAKQHLESHKSVQPVKVNKPVIVASEPGPLAGPPPGNKHSSSLSRRELQAPSASRSRPTRSNSVVTRTRFFSSVGSTDGDSAPPLPPMMPGLPEGEVLPDPDGPPCEACGLMCADDFDTVERFGCTFHADCFTCDECHLPLLKSENPDENNLFFNEQSELVKFCGPECRGALLQRRGNDMCPGCMCLFHKGEKAVEACGRLWHVAHLRCNDCRCVLGSTNKEFFPVALSEAQDVWPFCGDCHAKRFRTCAKCAQPIEGKDEAVDALGHVYHAGHFGCVRCGETLSGSEFYVDGHGENARALCDACWNGAASPRIACDACGGVLADKDDAVELAGLIYHCGQGKSCFKCAACKAVLQPGEVFESDDRPMCDACFFRKKGDSCARCKKVIQGELVEAEGATWHPECFACQPCGGLVMTGRYVMHNGLPMCEAHWLSQCATSCCGCGLVLDQKERIVVQGTKEYHRACLVCAHCRVPLITASQGGLALDVGPDDRFYCKLHAAGVCSFAGCTKPAFPDGAPLRRIANKFYCAEHYESMSRQWLPEACARCFQPIHEGDGLQAQNKWYHRARMCFVCFVCDEPFEDGEKFEILHGVVDGDPVHPRCAAL